MSVKETRTIVRQMTPENPSRMSRNSANLGLINENQPSSNPDQNRTETACLSGFSSWSLEEGRTEVGRGFDGNFIV